MACSRCVRELRSSPPVCIVGGEDGPPVPPMEADDEGGLSKLSPALQRLGQLLEAGFNVNAAQRSSTGGAAVLEAEQAYDELWAEEAVDHDSGSNSPSEHEDRLGTEIGTSGLKQGLAAGN
eukprot:9737285-Lingulodinium_polyedra.AAC.1